MPPQKPNMRSKILFAISMLIVPAVLLVYMSLSSPQGENQKTTGQGLPSLLVEGTHYTKVSRVADAPKSPTMFFWYGCPHCLKTYKAFEQQNFEATLVAKKTHLIKVPVAINPTWELHARLYYALSKAGLSDRGHIRVMELIQANRFSHTENEVKKIAKQIGEEYPLSMSLDSIISYMHSPMVDKKIKITNGWVNQIGLRGVPTALVGQRFVVELGGEITYTTFSDALLNLFDKGDK